MKIVVGAFIDTERSDHEKISFEIEIDDELFDNGDAGIRQMIATSIWTQSSVIADTAIARHQETRDGLSEAFSESDHDAASDVPAGVG